MAEFPQDLATLFKTRSYFSANLEAHLVVNIC